MKVVVGIDEAGYGPTLGPMVFGLTAFAVDRPGSLFPPLRGVVRRADSKTARRLVIDDSKKVFAGRRGLDQLELSALAFLRPGEAAPATLEQIVGRGASGTIDSERWPAWYQRRDEPEIPTAADLAEVESWRVKLASHLPDRGIRPLECRVEPILEGPWNESLGHTSNKAQTLLEFLAPLIRRVCQDYPDADIELHVDRLGGRRYYEQFLSALFPFRAQRALHERPRSSAYRIEDGGRTLEIAFEAGGDARHLPIALASICAKYVRELFLKRMNGHFAERRPGLKPTAGYPEDAQRFLTDIDGLLDSTSRAQLVRER